MAVNAWAALNGRKSLADYDGHVGWLLPVNKGRVVFAEVGGKPMSSVSDRLIDETRPSRLSSLLERTIVSPDYWHGMRRGREWMMEPHRIGA